MTTTLLRLTDGETTINFSVGDGEKLIEYTPQIALSFTQYIDDEFDVVFLDTPSNNRINIQKTNRLFEQARNYKSSETGRKVYIEIDPASSGQYWRSLITNGKIDLNKDVISPTWDTHFKLIIHITRQPFWEGELTQIPLSNSSAENNTSGITISNSSREIFDLSMLWDDETPILWDDESEIEWEEGSGAENFVDLVAADIIGDLPAPIKVELEHTKSGADAAKEFYIWHNVYSNPTSFTHILEAEDASGSTVTPSGADSTSSNNQYATLAWTNLNETLIAEWALSDTLMTNAAGGRFAVLARWRGVFPYTNAWMRLKLLTANDNVLWSGDLKLISSVKELAFLDSLRLPPYLANQASIKDIKMQLYGYRNVSGTHSINLDYLQLSPISGDFGWKRFLSIDDGIAHQEKFIHDDTEGFDYRVDTSDKLISEFSAFGGPILLAPNRNQRLYFNTCDKDNEAKIDQTYSVKLWYRPRRNAL